MWIKCDHYNLFLQIIQHYVALFCHYLIILLHYFAFALFTVHGQPEMIHHAM